jgi:phage shock protein A
MAEIQGGEMSDAGRFDAQEIADLNEKYENLLQRYAKLKAAEINNSPLRGYDGLVDRLNVAEEKIKELKADIPVLIKKCTTRMLKIEDLEEKLAVAVEELEFIKSRTYDDPLCIEELNVRAARVYESAKRALTKIKGE